MRHLSCSDDGRMQADANSSLLTPLLQGTPAFQTPLSSPHIPDSPQNCRKNSPEKDPRRNISPGHSLRKIIRWNTTLSSDKVATYFPSILTTRFVWYNFFVSLHSFQRLSRLNKALGVTVCLCQQGGVRGRTRGGSLSSEWGWGGGRADGECSLPRLKLPEPTCPPPPPLTSSSSCTLRMRIQTNMTLDSHKYS